MLLPVVKVKSGHVIYNFNFLMRIYNNKLTCLTSARTLPSKSPASHDSSPFSSSPLDITVLLQTGFIVLMHFLVARWIMRDAQLSIVEFNIISPPNKIKFQVCDILYLHTAASIVDMNTTWSGIIPDYTEPSPILQSG